MLTLREVQNVETEILSKVHDYCVANGLRYCLAYGTLLGAVRHHGFIPWDNDIDIFMPRADYDKLIDAARQGQKIGENLTVLHYDLDPKFHYFAARVCDTRTRAYPTYIREYPENLGVWIDLFAVDGIWEHPYLHPLWQAELFFCKLMQRADTYYMPGKKTASNRVKKLLLTLFGNKNNKFQRRAEELTRKCDFDKCGRGIDITDWERVNYDFYFTPEDFNEPLTVDFEGRKFFAPQKWDEHLKNTYGGNYMQLPPEDKRVTHDFATEWIGDGR